MKYLALVVLAAICAASLSGCAYQLGYATGKVVHTIIPTPPPDGN